MNKIFSEIELADSEFESYSFNSENGGLTLMIRSWDNKIIKIDFIDVIQFSYKLGDGLLGLYEVSGSNKFFKEALSRCYKEIPSDHPYKYYCVTDIQDYPFIEVVSVNVNVVKY